MKPTRVAFRYERRASAVFGAVHRPVARVELYSPVFQQWLAYTMVVDTGADYCVLPASVALDLGVELKGCESQTASGVGGQQRVFLLRSARMRLGPWEFQAPIGFLERDDLPPLLGRVRCVDRFDLRLCNFVTTLAARPRLRRH